MRSTPRRDAAGGSGARSSCRAPIRSNWSAAPWRAIDALIAERDPYCRGVVLLGSSASVEKLATGFREAQTSTSCRGFAVERCIFLEPSRHWLAGEIDDAMLIERVRTTFERLIRVWREAREGVRERAA